MKINVEKAKVKEWLDSLSTASREKYYPELWKRVHKLTAVPARRRASVNLYKIDKYTKEGDLVVVPGKVLSIGEMKHKVTIAAIDFSEPALKGLEKAGCRVVDIREMFRADSPFCRAKTNIWVII
ncbi:MAG: 50S ribosomal protein L18e [Candidatus Micrarchaeaceae archaeon]|jgi:large subunit ribosomal protein L18e|nr:50S ribosomal protein L18e [Candidatus Micrarchaeota archaeon]